MLGEFKTIDITKNEELELAVSPRRVNFTWQSDISDTLGLINRSTTRTKEVPLTGPKSGHIWHIGTQF